MEKVYQAVSPNGLQIPLALIRQYGLEEGSAVVLELEADSIRIVPAEPEKTIIENRALRYLLSWVGDTMSVEVNPLPDHTGWKVDVYGTGLTQPAGTLVYSLSGVLLTDRSTPPAEIRRTFLDANQPKI